jgi:hypothetical protein
LIYPPKLEIKETTDTASSASFLDIYLEDPLHHRCVVQFNPQLSFFICL